jgi:hypothetical protein
MSPAGFCSRASWFFHQNGQLPPVSRLFLSLASVFIIILPGCERTGIVMSPPTLKGCLAPADALTPDGQQKTGFANPQSTAPSAMDLHTGQFWVTEGELVKVILSEFTLEFRADSGTTVTCTQHPMTSQISCPEDNNPLFHGDYEVQIIRCPGQTMCEAETAEVLKTCHFTNDVPIPPGDDCLQFQAKGGNATYYLIPSIVFTDPRANPQVLKGSLTSPIKISNPASLPFASAPAPSSDQDLSYNVSRLVDNEVLHFILPQEPLDACPAPQGNPAPATVTWSESFTSRVQVQDVWFTKDDAIVPVCGMNVGGAANYCPAPCTPGTAEPCIVPVASCPVLRSDKAAPAYLASSSLALLDWSPVFGHDPDVNGPDCHQPAPGDGNFQIHFGLKVVP